MTNRTWFLPSLALCVALAAVGIQLVELKDAAVPAAEEHTQTEYMEVVQIDLSAPLEADVDAMLLDSGYTAAIDFDPTCKVNEVRYAGSCFHVNDPAVWTRVQRRLNLLPTDAKSDLGPDAALTDLAQLAQPNPDSLPTKRWTLAYLPSDPADWTYEQGQILVIADWASTRTTTIAHLVGYYWTPDGYQTHIR